MEVHRTLYTGWLSKLKTCKANKVGKVGKVSKVSKVSKVGTKYTGRCSTQWLVLSSQGSCAIGGAGSSNTNRWDSPHAIENGLCSTLATLSNTKT